MAILANGVTIADQAEIKEVRIAAEYLDVLLKDRRRVFIPLSWYPRLKQATQAQRDDLEIIAGGIGVHWPQLDEDLSIKGFLAGACDY